MSDENSTTHYLGLADLIAARFHEAYERLAPSFGYHTRAASAKSWSEVPEGNKQVMRAVVRELLDRRVISVPFPGGEPETAEPASDEPARCEHGETEAHELWRDHEYRDDGHGQAEHAPYCKCKIRTCPGPVS